MYKKSNEWPYDCSPDKALENLILAAGCAFVSGMDGVRLWKGVILSMLEGKKPPFKIGDKVVWQMGDGKHEVVTGVIYVGNNRWQISVRGINEDSDDGMQLIQIRVPPRFHYAEDWTLASD